MTSCELIKCRYYINNKCTEPYDYVNKYTGEDMCSRNPDAIPREEFDEDYRINEIVRTHEVSYNQAYHILEQREFGNGYKY